MSKTTFSCRPLRVRRAPDRFFFREILERNTTLSGPPALLFGAGSGRVSLVTMFGQTWTTASGKMEDTLSFSSMFDAC